MTDIISDNTLATARNVGSLTSTLRNFSDSVNFNLATFYDDRNDVFRFTIDTASNFSLNLSLLNSNFNINTLSVALADANGNSLRSGIGGSIIYTGLAAGTYYIGLGVLSTTVAQYPSGAFLNYNLSMSATPLTPTPTPPPTNDILNSTSTTSVLSVNGAAGASTINVASDQDWFRVSLNAGTAYQFRLNGNGLSDPYLRLLGSTGNEITYNDDGGGNNNSLISYTPTTSGTFYLSAQGYGSNTGAYLLTATSTTITPPTPPPTNDILNSTSTTSVLIVNGAAGASTINVASDQDWFRVSLNAGTAYQFRLNGNGLSDPYLRLLGSTGNEITYNDDGGGNNNSLISYTPTTSGTFYLSAQGYGSNTGAYLLTATSATPPPVISLTSTPVTHSEGNSGSTAYTFTVTRSNGNGASTVNYSVNGATDSTHSIAASANDFVGGVLPTGVVNFASGVLSQIITVNVAGDTAVETAERFNVTLSNPTNATLGNSSDYGYINNDDTAPPPVISLTSTPVTHSEGNSGSTAYTFTVTRSNGNGASTVNYSVNGATDSTHSIAASANDFVGGVLPTGVVNFASGVLSQIITVNVAGDTAVENAERFNVTLSNPTNATLGNSSDYGYINNDDVATPPPTTIPTRPYFIKALDVTVDHPTYHWGVIGQQQIITYSFFDGNGVGGSQTYSNAQKQVVRDALAKYHDIAGLTFSEVVDNSNSVQISFHINNQDTLAGSANFPREVPANGGLYMDDNQMGTYTNGVYTPNPVPTSNNVFEILLHEIGHSLGLKHPEDGLVTLPSNEITKVNTIMRHNLDAPFNDIGMFDKATIHYLYGVNQTARAGNDTYHISDRYIWDGAGIDTLDATEQTANVFINLNAGSWIHSGARNSSILATGQAFIGYVTQIENVTGGSGHDTIQGNAVANNLSGGSGNDTLNGGAGNDTLTGGVGLDTFVFNNAPITANIDRITDFNPTNDTIQLENSIFTSLVNTGVLSASSFRFGAGVTTAADTNDFIIYNSTSGGLYYDADGSNGASAPVAVALLGTNLALTNADFVII